MRLESAALKEDLQGSGGLERDSLARCLSMLLDITHLDRQKPLHKSDFVLYALNQGSCIQSRAITEERYLWREYAAGHHDNYSRLTYPSRSGSREEGYFREASCLL